jgi:hypothetical protein
MTVYRIEDKAHQGPYSNPAFRNRLNDYTALADHPRGEWETWTSHGAHVSVDTALYGFASLPALHNWFSADDLAYLAANGYQVATYDVPADRVDIGRYQCRFNP